MRKLYGLIAVSLLLLAASCDPVDEKKGSTTTTTSGSGSTDAGGPIVLGFNFEETGDAATFGQSSHKGAEMAVDELNATGGILGRQINAVWGDNANDSSQSATVATKLINQDKADVLIGCVASSNSLAMAKIAEQSKVPMVSPASTRPDVTMDENGAVRRYIFRTCFTDDFQGEAITDFIVNGDIKGKKAVIFYDAENDYSVGIWERIKQIAASKGLQIVAEDSYLGKSETDFRPRLTKFKGQQFDVMIIPGYYNQVGQIANQARELGITQPMIGGDGWDSADLWKVAGKNIEGSYFTNHYASDDKDPAVQDFIRKYKERNGGNVPDAMAILAYDAVMVVADAIERAGGTDKEKVADALAATQGFAGAAGTISINEMHNASKKLVVLEIGDGGALKWVYTFDPSDPSGRSKDAGDEAADGVADGASADSNADSGDGGAQTPSTASGQGG